MAQRSNSKSYTLSEAQAASGRYLTGTGRLTGLPDSSQYRSSPSEGQVFDLTWRGIKSTSKLDIKKLKLRWGGTWLAHRPQALKSVLQYGPPLYEFDGIMASSLREGEKAELCRFLLTLKLWETTPGEKIITAAEVWHLSLTKGPAAAEYLDDLFALTWREKEMGSYNFCFPARFLPRFLEGSDDIQYSLSETHAFPGEVQDFRRVLMELLDELEPYRGDIKLADDRLVLEDRTTTTSYLADTDETLPHWEASFRTSKFAETRLEAKRCVVNVYPGGTRDTIIADKAANNSIRWLDRSITNILSFVPESALSIYPSVFDKRKRDVVYHKGMHVLRDIKKCGLTYNVKELFPVLEECLNRKFPDHRWRRFGIFQNMIVHDGDQTYYPQRGYGLGMANAAVTLCNIVVHRMTLERLKDSPRVGGFCCKAIFGNDDADVVIWTKKMTNAAHIAAEYMEVESETHAGLGNITNPKKSVIKPYGLFYEEYNKRGWRSKEALVCNALACAYLAPSIRVAKHYIFSQSSRFTSRWARQQLANLATWWGTEFYDHVGNELEVHYEVGGWLDLRMAGLKTSLLDIDYLIRRGYSVKYISWVAHTAKKFLEPPRPIFKTRGIVENALYSGFAVHTDPRIQLFTLTTEDLVDYYKRLTTFQRRYDIRLQRFIEKGSKFVINDDYTSLVSFILGETPWHAIPESLGEECSLFRSEDYEVKVATEIAAMDKELLSGENLLQYVMNPDCTPDWLLGCFLTEGRIPEEAVTSSVYCNPATLFAASQFSNSGALPIYEYNRRVKKNPAVRLGLGKPKFVQAHYNIYRPILRSSFFEKKPVQKKKKKKEQEEVIIRAENAESESVWIDEDPQDNFSYEEDPDEAYYLDMLKRQFEDIQNPKQEEEEPPPKEETPPPLENPIILTAQSEQEFDSKIDALLGAASGDSHTSFMNFNSVASTLFRPPTPLEEESEAESEDYDFGSLW